MNDDEVKLVLLDANSIILDELYYSEKQHSQLLLDVEGISLERVSFSAATSNSDNWKSASCLSGCSTPTEKNSQAIDALLESKFISINPSVISPDADGFDDNMQIEISNESASMWGSLQIANYNGTVVRNLIIADLIGTNEKIIWDGTDNKKQIVSSGIYILIAQLVSENGVVKNIRLPIIVAEGKR
jgi:hypothetical protein